MKICQEEETLYNTIAINATTNKSLPIIKFNAINAINDAFRVEKKKSATITNNNYGSKNNLHLK